jgi:hypothetical protein
MLKKLLPEDLYAHIREAYVDPCYPDVKLFETLSLHNGQTGAVMKDITMPGMIRVDRNRMRNLCTTGIPIQYGKSLDSLQYYADGKGVTAHFQDGTTASGDLVIGADGARSIVREQLLGEEKARLIPSPTVSLMMKVNFNDIGKALHARSGNPTFKAALHPKGTMNLITSKLTLCPQGFTLF